MKQTNSIYQINGDDLNAAIFKVYEDTTDLELKKLSQQIGNNWLHILEFIFKLELKSLSETQLWTRCPYCSSSAADKVCCICLNSENHPSWTCSCGGHKHCSSITHLIELINNKTRADVRQSLYRWIEEFKRRTAPDYLKRSGYKFRDKMGIYKINAKKETE